MRLTDLTAAIPGLRLPPHADGEVTGVASDSRRVKPGDLFVAFAGSRDDGARYVSDALAKGASAVLAAEDMDVPEGIPVLRHLNPRLALSLAAAALHPGQPETMIAVTGTDGKTSTVHFVRELWRLAGHRAASIGTLGILSGDEDAVATHTTPDPVALHTALEALAAKGVTHAAMEASSHGLHQHRLDGVRLKAAGFTNLTRDHLDYHGTLAAYYAAKKRLFLEVLPEGTTAVLGADDERFADLAQGCRARGIRVIDFGRAAEALALLETLPTPSGQDVHLRVNGRAYTVALPLVGAFQAMNVLCALGLAAATGEDAEALLAHLPELPAVPGRMERAAVLQNGAAVYVDYAHTPAALANVLTAVRPHTSGNLSVVFGCGGERDRGKRPEMAAAAVTLADHVIVTDDNPRGEDAAAIRREVLAGANGHATEIGDRGEAIRAAVRTLQPGDVLVLAGKGHETGQILAARTLPFDDREEARAAVREMEG